MQGFRYQISPSGDTWENVNNVRDASKVHLDGARVLVTTNTLGVRADVANIETVLNLIKLNGLPRNGPAFLATFVNPSSIVLAVRNQSFRASLSRFDLVAPDGIGMCMAIRWLHGLTAERISFDNTSLAPYLFELASREGLSVALIGSKHGVADQARRRVLEHFPDLNIVAAIDGYGDFYEKISLVHKLSVDVVICGMGARVQEEFLLQLRDSNWTGCGFTCGGFFDQLLDGYFYYPSCVNSLGLRWAYRLIKEPRRLWRRYLIEYGYFGIRLCSALLYVFAARVRGYNVHTIKP